MSKIEKNIKRSLIINLENILVPYCKLVVDFLPIFGIFRKKFRGIYYSGPVPNCKEVPNFLSFFFAFYIFIFLLIFFVL
jgi:hypothetical protein